MANLVKGLLQFEHHHKSCELSPALDVPGPRIIALVLFKALVGLTKARMRQMVSNGYRLRTVFQSGLY